MTSLRRLWRAAVARVRDSEAGATLAELLMVISIASIIMLAIASAFVVAAQTTVQARTRLNESSDVAFLNSYFVGDASGATSMSTTAVPACGSGLSPVLLFRWTDAGTPLEAFYARPTASSPLLVRLHCREGVTTPITRNTLARNVGSTEVGCPSPAACTAAGMPAHVHLIVHELSGYSHTLQSSPRATTALVADSGPPTVRWIKRVFSNPTNRGLVSWTVNFNEPVTGVNIGANSDFTLAPQPTGSSIVQLIGSGSTYTVVANSGTANSGSIRLNLLDNNSIKDTSSALNPLGGSTTGTVFNGETYDIDKNRPTVQLRRITSTSPPISVPIVYTADFNEDVDFEAGDVVLVGTAQAERIVVTKSPTDSTLYTVEIWPLDGSVIPSIPENSATDLAGNGNQASTAANILTVNYSVSAPRVLSIDRLAANPMNASSVSWRVTFSEHVTGVGRSDFDLVTGGGVTGVSDDDLDVDGSGAVYTVTLDDTGSGSGTLGLNLIDNGSIEDDPSGNDLVGAGGIADGRFTGQSYTIDRARPTVAITVASNQPATSTQLPVNFTVVFNDPVTGFGDAASDLTLGGTASGTKTAIVTGSGSTYNVAVTGATGDGTITASVNADAARDSAGNGNTASPSSAQVTYDGPPSVTISAVSDPAYSLPVNFTVAFSEAVTGFNSSDVTVTGTAPGTKTIDVTSTGATTYNVAVGGATGYGTIIASANAGGATDSSGSPNTASGTAQVTYSAPPPPAGFDIQATPASPANNRPGLNDKIIYTFNQEMSAASIRGGWNGTSTAVTASFTRGSGQSTVLTISGVNLGTVNLGDDSNGRYMGSGGSAQTRTATMAMALVNGRSVITITLTGTTLTGGDNNGDASTTLVWTPSSSATNLAGAASSVTPVTQSGGPKQNF